MPHHVLLYGVAIREAVARGDLEEMRAFAAVSAAMLEGASDSDLESEELEAWKTAHEEIVVAIAEASGIELDSENIVAIKDGIVVIDNLELARALKPVVDSDLEPRVTITISW